MKLLPLWAWRINIRRLNDRPVGLMVSVYQDRGYRVWSAI